MAKKPAKKPNTRPKAKPRKSKNTSHALPEAVRAEIVTRLAMWDTIALIQADLIDRGYDISHQGISAYNPYNNSSQRSPKWKALFDKTREDFLAGMAEIPIASRSYRLRRLQDVFTIAFKRGATAEARATLEQAAKEVGDVFTNKSKIDGQLAAPLGLSLVRTDDEARNMLADRLGEALLRLPAPAKPTIQ